MTDLSTPITRPVNRPPIDRPQSMANTGSAPAEPGSKVTTRQAALIAAGSYVVLFVLAIFANFFVREGAIVTGDAQATAANITGSETLFRLGLLSFLVIFVLDVVVAWALHLIFAPADRSLSLLAAWLRLTYTVLLGVAIIFLFQTLQLLSGADVLTAFEPAQLEAQAMVALDSFNSTWLVGLAAFGLHLIVIGWLMHRRQAGPRSLGWILMAAGTAYVIDTVAHVLLADYAEYQTALTVMVVLPAVVAEGWFTLWLFLRAGKGPAPVSTAP